MENDVNSKRDTLISKLEKIMNIAEEKHVKEKIKDLIIEIWAHLKKARKAYEEDENTFIADGLSYELGFFNLDL